MSATLELLQPIPLFADLTADELARIAELCESKRCPMVRMLSGRLRSTNDSLKSFLALSMF